MEKSRKSNCGSSIRSNGGFGIGVSEEVERRGMYIITEDTQFCLGTPDGVKESSKRWAERMAVALNHIVHEGGGRLIKLIVFHPDDFEEAIAALNDEKLKIVRLDLNAGGIVRGS